MKEKESYRALRKRFSVSKIYHGLVVKNSNIHRYRGEEGCEADAGDGKRRWGRGLQEEGIIQSVDIGVPLETGTFCANG